MDIKILEIKEVGKTLRIKVETEFGIDTLGVSADKKYKDPFTGQYLWQSDVKELLERKYPLNKEGLVERKEIHKEFKNKTFKLSKFHKANPKKK